MEASSSNNNPNQDRAAQAKKEWKDFNDYQKAEYLANHKADCSFVVGRSDAAAKSFPCHKWIIKDASEAIQAMLLNGFFEESRNSHGIRITDTDPDTFQSFLDFIYYRHVSNSISLCFPKIRDLIYLGEKYLIAELKDSCIAMISQNLIHFENRDLLYAFEYAYFVEDKDLIKRCKKIIADRLPKRFNFNKAQNIDSSLNVINGPEKPNSVGVGIQSSFSFSSSSNSHSLFGQTNSPTQAQNIFCKTKPNTFGSQTIGITTTEEKVKIPEAESDEIVNFGVDKGYIISCPHIYDLNPPIFYEFQKTLKQHVSEFERFNMIEMYAKVNAARLEMLDHVENSDESCIVVKNIINNEDEEHRNDSKNHVHTDQSGVQAEKAVPERNEILNMMLCSINFSAMSAKEFCRGPRHSSLLSAEEKLSILSSIEIKT